MKLRAIAFLVFALSCSYANAASKLPTLHTIMEANFSASYSCNGDYDRSALFLSDYSKVHNVPDLLFNGACGSDDYVEASTAGDDISLIADLGDVAIEEASASKLLNWSDIVDGDNTFKATAKIQKNHTYGVLISKSEIRALYVFRVVDLVPNKSMAIKYAVKSYSFQQSVQASPGFDWELGSK